MFVDAKKIWKKFAASWLAWVFKYLMPSMHLYFWKVCPIHLRFSSLHWESKVEPAAQRHKQYDIVCHYCHEKGHIKKVWKKLNVKSKDQQMQHKWNEAKEKKVGLQSCSSGIEWSPFTEFLYWFRLLWVLHQLRVLFYSRFSFSD